MDAALQNYTHKITYAAIPSVTMDNTELSSNSNIKNKSTKNGHNVDFKIYIIKESLGDLIIYKCIQCTYMALSIKDIKQHIKVLHLNSDENKTNSILMKCPGCPGQFFTESFLKTHLHSHHKMLIKDISKLILVIEKEIKSGQSSLINIGIGDDKGSLSFCSNSIPFVGISDDSKKSKPYDAIYDQNDNRPEKPSNIDNNLLKFKSGRVQYDEINQKQFPNIEILEDSQNNVTVCENSELTDCVKKTNSFDDTTQTQILTIPNNFKEIKMVKSKIAPYCESKFQKKITNQSNTVGYKCDIQNCKLRLKSLENISYHKSCHLNNTKNLTCPECRKHFATVEELHSHLWRLHKIDLELHACNQCSYKAYSLNRLINIHMKIHSDERNYSCKVCLKTFKNSKQLGNHSKVHKKKVTRSKNIFCNICKREFGSSTFLKVHVKNVHEKFKQFTCKYCEFSTCLKSSLLLHLRCHTGEKPYHCSECNFKAANRGTLKRHLMTHSQQKIYNCDNCSYSCIQASSIKAHIKLKHPGLKTNLLFSCPHCSFTTVNKANHAAHIFTHGANDRVKNKDTSSIDLTSENSKENEEIKFEDSRKTGFPTNENLIAPPDPEMIFEDLSQDFSDECFLVTEKEPYDIYAVNKDAIGEMEVVPNNKPICVKNIFDLTSHSTRLNNTIFENLDDQNNSKNLSIVGNENLAQNVIEEDYLHSNIYNENSDEIRHNMIFNNDVLINNSNENIISRKKPKISVKSNLILKGPDKVYPFNPQSSFSDFHSLPQIYLPQHLVFNEDTIHSKQNDGALSDLTPFDLGNNNESMGSDFHHILYDSFHQSEYSLQNFQSPTVSMDAMNSDITQYILDEQSELLKRDDNIQLSIETKGENNLIEALKTDLMEINNSDASYLTKNSQYSDNKSYLTLIQPPIKCEDKVNTEYFSNKDIISDEIHTFSSNLDHFPVIEELPIVFYDSTEIENNNNDDTAQNYTVNEIITVDETSCDTKSLMNSGSDLKLNFIHDNYN